MARTVVEANQESADEADARQAERDAAVQKMKERHKQLAASGLERERAHFQEWLDHWQRAWVPVAVVSELALRWPKVARANQITVTQQGNVHCRQHCKYLPYKRPSFRLIVTLWRPAMII